jgi:hypothetical protein
VLFDGIDCTNNRDGTPVVVYLAAGIQKEQKIFVREKAEFEEKFELVQTQPSNPDYY